MTNRINSPSITPSLGLSLEETFLTENELATRQRRQAKTLRNDRVRGSYIPYIKIGRQVRYRLSEVIAHERACRVSCSGCPSTSADLRDETFLTPRELASRHQRDEKTLRNDRVYRRYISFYKLGGQVRYALSDVLAYEQAHRMMSTSTVDLATTDNATCNPSIN